jgi:hypothetical protein
VAGVWCETFLLWLAMEGMYRPLWRSEILPELEYHETRELIDRNEQPGATALGVDPAWAAMGGTRSVSDDVSAVFDRGLCPDRYENASTHWLWCTGTRRKAAPCTTSRSSRPRGSHRIDLSRDGEDGGSSGRRLIEARVRLTSPR